MSSTPPGALSLPQSFQLPSFSKLADNQAKIEIIAHHPNQADEEILEVDSTFVDLRVSAIFDSPERQEFDFFRSRHTEQQRQALSIDYLFSRPTLDQEALITLYPPARIVSDAESVRKRWLSGVAPSNLQERANYAQLEVEEGRSEAFTSFGQGPVAALPHFLGALALLDGVEDHDSSRAAMTVRCWYAEASKDLAAIIEEGNPKRLTVLSDAVSRLERVLASCPECVGIRRWTADLHFVEAAVLASDPELRNSDAAMAALDAESPTPLLSTRTSPRLPAPMSSSNVSIKHGR